MAKPMRILSIDGGGIRGLIPATVLVELQKILRECTRDEDAQLVEHFDLVAGTSTGGLIACLLLLPDDTGAPVYRAADIVEFYRDNGPVLFERSLVQRVLRAEGLLGARYGSAGFQRALDNALRGRGDVMLSQLLKPTVIPTFNATSGHPYFFKQHQASGSGGRDFRVRDVALATAAAPAVFDTAQLRFNGRDAACVDGMVFANNPTMCAYAEARNLSGTGVRDMAILSLGTGERQPQKPVTPRKMRKWGVVQWALPLLDVMISGSARAVDHQVGQIFQTLDDPNAAERQYLRVQAQLSEDSVAKIDNVGRDNLDTLVRIGEELADENRERLKAFVKDQLVGEKEPRPSPEPREREPAIDLREPAPGDGGAAADDVPAESAES